MNNQNQPPYITWDQDEDPTKVNMTRVRALLHLSDQRALYVPEQDAWAFPLGQDTQALHLFGPLYQTHGTPEKFAIVGELTNYTTGIVYNGDTNPETIATWIEKTTNTNH